MKNKIPQCFVYVLLMSTFALVSGRALAADSSAVQIEKEQEIAQKAKKKLYPGGADEGELKVQATLTPPKRKISPTLPDSAPSEVEETPEPETH